MTLWMRMSWWKKPIDCCARSSADKTCGKNEQVLSELKSLFECVRKPMDSRVVDAHALWKNRIACCTRSSADSTFGDKSHTIWVRLRDSNQTLYGIDCDHAAGRMLSEAFQAQTATAQKIQQFPLWVG